MLKQCKLYTTYALPKLRKAKNNCQTDVKNNSNEKHKKEINFTLTTIQKQQQKSLAITFTTIIVVLNELVN